MLPGVIILVIMQNALLPHLDILVAVTWTAETENLNPKTPSPIFHVVMKNLQILCNYVNP